MTSQGYVRYPAIYQDRIVFVSEDDLWLVSSEGGRAERLTAGLGEVSYPRFSPDGTQLAFVGQEEGPGEVYVMPAAGDVARRLSYQGASCRVSGWMPDGAEIFMPAMPGSLTGLLRRCSLLRRVGVSRANSLTAWQTQFHLGRAAKL